MAKKYLQLGSILKKLLFNRDMKPIDLSREVSIPAPTIHRLITGKTTRPYKTSLEPIAAFFSISVEQLVGEQPIPDTKPSMLDANIPTDITQIPLIPWNDLPHLRSIHTNNLITIPFAGLINSSAFATIMPDSSMEPLFSNDCILIFDPQISHKDRSYVLVHLEEPGMFVFRQLLIDSNDMYLKPLNPDLTTFRMKLIGENDKIIGTLIEARQCYHDL